jgi:hypothetical protein
VKYEIVSNLLLNKWTEKRAKDKPHAQSIGTNQS